MGALLKLVPHAQAMSDLPSTLNADPWATASDAQRRTADVRAALIDPMADMVRAGAKPANVVRLVLAQASAGTLSVAQQHALATMDGGVSPATLKRWLAAFLARGKAGLLPKHTGRVRQDYGWELRAVALYNVPSKPGFADVAWRLRAEGHESATESRVKRYLKSLPATLGDKSPARVGPHLHRLTRQKYQRRNLDEVLVGEIYAGDGHTVDCYLAHPNTGKPFRPELTAFIDIKSRYIAGWTFTESESAVSTLYALSNAMTTYDHVPAWLYIDRGAGYRAKMLCDENTGWYQKFDIAVIGAIPGNPHGKGWIERWFRTCRDKHDKFFDNGRAYCGDDQAEETNRRMSAEVESGRRQLRSFLQYVQSFADFVAEYHNTPMDVLGGRTPAQVWAELTPIAVGVEADAVMRPSEHRKVRRQSVTLHNRTYFHEALALYDDHKVEVEYDLHKDRLVWIRDLKGRFICEAKLVNTVSVLPTSRLEEQRDKRLQGQQMRLEKKVDEARARRADAITAADQVAAIESLNPDAISHADPGADQGGEIHIDITDWRNEE